MGPKKGLKAGSKAAPAAQAASKPSEGLAQVAAAYLRFCKSPASLKALKKAAADHPSALAELCLAKAALLQGVQAATKAGTLAEGEAVLVEAAHKTLEHVVTAAVEHRSLVALHHSVLLLEHALLGLPGWEEREVQRKRLVEGRPPGELKAQGAAAFDQLGQDVIEQDLWLGDAGYSRKDGSLQGAEAFVRRVVGEYQRKVEEVAALARRQGADFHYDRAMFDVRESDLRLAAALEDPDDEEPPSLSSSTAPLSLRLVHMDYLPKSAERTLGLWASARSMEEHKRRRLQRQRQQERQAGSAEGLAAKARLMQASGAELMARRQAQQLASVLRQQLNAEGATSDSAGGPASQDRQVAALLRLASVPLPDLRRLLEEEAAAGGLEEGEAAAAAAAAAAGNGVNGTDAAASAAAAEHGSVARAIQLLLTGGVGAAQFTLPDELQQRAHQLPGRSSSSGGGALASSSSGSGPIGRQSFHRLLQQLVGDREALAQCKQEMLQEIPQFKLVFDRVGVAPEDAPTLPPDYTMTDLDLPPSVEAILPTKLYRDIVLKDFDVFRGPVWRPKILDYQRQVGASRAGGRAEKRGRGINNELHTLSFNSDDTACEYFERTLSGLLDFDMEDISLSHTVAVHQASVLLAKYIIGTDPCRTKMEMCLKQVLLGHGLIEAVVEQQARQPAAHTDSRHGARTAGFLGGLRGWAAGSSLQDDSDDEAAGGLAGTFVGGDSPGLLGSRSAMSSVAAAPTAEAAAHLAALHAAAASVHAAPFTELLSRIVWDGKQRERGLQAATGAMAAASEARGVALTREAGYLVLHLLPMSDKMAAAAAGGAGVINTEEIEQLRAMVLQRILAALRHLASQGRLVRHPLMQAAVNFVSVGLEQARLHALLRPGSDCWAPWNRLGVAPLTDLLVMYGTVAAYFSREFAAGPAALGPEFQDVLAHALSGVELLPSVGVLAEVQQREQLGAEGAAAAAAAAAASTDGVPAVGLSRLGLAAAVSAASAVQRGPAERLSTPAQLVRKSILQATAMPPNLPVRALPPAGECATSLAQCCAGVPPLALLKEQLRDELHGEPASGALAALDQLRRLQLWRNLTLHAYHGTDSLRQQQTAAVRQFAQLMQLVGKLADWDEGQSLSELLCGTGATPGLLGELKQRCDGMVDAFVDQCYQVQLFKLSQQMWQWRCVVEQLTALNREVRVQLKGLPDGSATKRTLSQFLSEVSALARAIGHNVMTSCAALMKEEGSRAGKMEFVTEAVPLVKVHAAQLVGCVESLEELEEAVQGTDGSNAAVRAVVLSYKERLHRLNLATQTVLKDRLSALVESRQRMFYMADLVLRSEMSVFSTHFCMQSPLDPLADQLLGYALPRKWEQQMATQNAAEQAAAGLLRLGAPPTGQPSASKEEAEAAATGGKERQAQQAQQEQQQQDEQEQQRQAQAEAKRQQEAAAAAAALLEEEEQQAERQAKQRQRKEQVKKQAVQQRAAAAAAAAAAKRKAAEEAAAAEAAAAAAAQEEAEREAEQRRQAQLAEERRRQEQLLQERLEEQTRREAELLNRQRREAEQRRRQEEEAEQRWRQEEAAEQRRQQQLEAERKRQQQEAEQRRRQEEAEKQAQAEPQRQEQAMQQQDGTQDAGAPAVVTPVVAEQLPAGRAAAAPAAGLAAAAAPARMLRQALGGRPAPLKLQQQPQQQQQQPQSPRMQLPAVPQSPRVQPPQPQAAPQAAAPPAVSSRQAGSIDWEAEAAAAERLLGADGELDFSKLSLGDALPSSSAGPAGAAGAAGAAASARGAASVANGRPGSGGPAGRQAVLVPATRPGSAGGQRPGSAGSERPGLAGAADQAERPPARFVSWTGAWVCECGQRNESIKEHCRRCDARDPCLRWFQGNCDESRRPCRLPHLWFDLPSEKPRREDKAVPGTTLARPNPNFIYKRKPRAAAAKPAKPAAAAWSHPGLAAPAGASWDTAAGQGQQQLQQQQPPPPQPPPPQQQPQPQQQQPPLQQAAGGAVPPSGSWAAVAKPPPAAAEPAAGQPAEPPPQQPAQPQVQPPAQPDVGQEAEDELASLLDNLGIGASSAAADLAPSSTGWSFDAAAPVAGVPAVPAPGAVALPAEAPGSWPAPGQDAEDAELEAAIQASLADAAAAASRHQAGAWQELPAAPSGGAGGAAAAGDSESLALAGLRNEAGEYNCFLNVVVQCLWRCAEFRQQVAGWDAGFRARDPVLAALHSLFAQLEQQEAARSSAAAHSGDNGGRLPPVDPAPLREALAALPGQGFGLGEMNDAAELLLCMYEKVMEAEGASGRATELAATFGLAVREEVHCAACGKTTHQNAYTQYFYNTQATTLQLARLVAEAAVTMGALLRDAEAQHRKSCDTDMRGCGALNSVNHFLQAAPRVFTLQVAWETHAPEPDVVAGTLAALDETVDLGEVYQGVDRGVHRYALRSMVCYYGQHYQALVLVPEAGGWLMFDDTRVTRVGSWADVRRKCEAGRIQPSVLFYEAA